MICKLPRELVDKKVMQNAYEAGHLSTVHGYQY